MPSISELQGRGETVLGAGGNGVDSLEVQVGKFQRQLRGGALDLAGDRHVRGLGRFHHLEADHGLAVEIGEAAPFGGAAGHIGDIGETNLAARAGG